MLTFIGLGVWEETDISLKGLEALKRSDIIFAESYTSESELGTLARLEKLVGKDIVLLPREEVEEGKRILLEAQSKRVAFLVPGDPMISTTHASLRLEAMKKQIETRIIHGSSILTAAISASGLHAYKFGRPVTVPFWSEGYEPTSTLDAVEENLARGLHTMLFLDLKADRRMTALEALEQLERVEMKRGGNLFSAKTDLVVLSRVGSETEKVSYGTAERLKKAALGDTPYILIWPGKLHFTEEEMLSHFKV